MSKQKYLIGVRQALDSELGGNLTKDDYLEALEEIAADVEARIDCVTEEIAATN